MYVVYLNSSINRENVNMGSSLCAKVRNWRKTRAQEGKIKEDAMPFNVNEENQEKTAVENGNLRRTICHEEDEDEMKPVSYTKQQLGNLIVELEKELQASWCNKPEREKLLLELGHVHYKYCKFEKARDYYEQHFDLVRKRMHSLSSLQRAYCNLGCVYRRLGDFDKAANFLETGLAIAEEAQDLRSQGRFYNNLGNICEIQRDFEGAIFYHSKRRKIAEILKDGDSEAKASASIANAYHCIGNLRRSITYYESVVLWLKRKLGKDLLPGLLQYL